jgi:hypothetical protein
MRGRKKTTEWPEGFEAYIRCRQFTDVEELLLWDCANMFESFQEALARWEALGGRVHQVQMRAEEWKAVRGLADEISMERFGAPLRMHAIRWGCALARRLEQRYLVRDAVGANGAL